MTIVIEKLVSLVLTIGEQHLASSFSTLSFFPHLKMQSFQLEICEAIGFVQFCKVFLVWCTS